METPAAAAGAAGADEKALTAVAIAALSWLPRIVVPVPPLSSVAAFNGVASS
jgi:hypothetical protein